MIGPQLPAGQQTQPGPAELWGQQAEEVQHGHLHLLAAPAEEVSQGAALVTGQETDASNVAGPAPRPGLTPSPWKIYSRQLSAMEAFGR